MNFGEWISTADRLPEAVFGPEDGQAEVSEDVLCWFTTGFEVANYDYVRLGWAMANEPFDVIYVDPD